jgi:hypothetical protein
MQRQLNQMLGKQRVNDDPAAGAASLILRIGVLVLAIGAPCGAVVSRRILFVLMPVGAVLILIGAMLSDDGLARLKRHASQAFLSPILVIGTFLLLWIGLSLMWTPYIDQALERFLKTAGTVALAGAAIASLPDHMKASNSNLVAIGTAAAALAIACVAILAPGITRSVDPDGTTLQRAGIGVVVLLWPALGALVLRDRIAAAGAIAVVTAVSIVLVWTPLALSALIIGMLTFSCAYSNPTLTGRVLGGLAAGLVLIAPVIPLALSPLLPNRIDPTGLASLLSDWGTVVRHEGLRLVTGHGFDAAIRAMAAGLLPPRTPRGLLFEIWYELGVTGAVAVAGLIWFSFQAAAGVGRLLAPFMLAAVACVLTIAISGLAGAQLWWVTLLCVVGVAFAIVLRGHYRTERVQAQVLPRQRPKL